MFRDIDWTAMVIAFMIVLVVLTPVQVGLQVMLRRRAAAWPDRRAMLVFAAFGALTAALLWVVYRLITP